MTGNSDRDGRGGFRGRWRKVQRGFTLIELVAVMAILAIMVAVVAPNVVGQRKSSIESQALTDATQVRTAASDFFKNQNESEVRTPHSVTTVTEVNGVALTNAEQVVSSRWPELYITESGTPPDVGATGAPESLYKDVFDTDFTDNADDVLKVDKVVLLGKDGQAITENVLERYTAIDLDRLVTENILQKKPEGLALKTKGAPNFLWLFRKISSSAATEAEDDSREVTVWNLVKAEELETAAADGGELVLTYKRIF